jgi:hypothetical protein
MRSRIDSPAAPLNAAFERLQQLEARGRNPIGGAE